MGKLNNTENFVNIRQKKKKIRNLLKEEECKEKIKSIIDSRCLKLININGSSLILKANKKLREYDEQMFNGYINEFIKKVFELFRIDIDIDELSIITELSYCSDDNKVIIDF